MNTCDLLVNRCLFILPSGDSLSLWSMTEVTDNLVAKSPEGLTKA